MEDLLQIQLEFSESEARSEITKEAIATTIREAFLGMGIEPSVVQAGVDQNINLDRESPLGVDPGVAALVIATIGVGMDLIKIAVDLYKQHREQQEESKKHLQDIKLELAKLQLEREKFEFAKQRREARSLTDGDDSKTDQERIRDLLDSVLIARLIEQHHIQHPEYRFDVLQRR